MILFYVIRESETLRSICKQIESETQINIAWLNQYELVNSGLFYSENINNKIHGTIQLSEDSKFISTKDIKICFVAQFPYIAGEWIPYENYYDKIYAQQEWNASMVATFLTQEHIKYINPLVAKFDLNTELEQLMLLQQFNIKTVDIVLTNNSDKALEHYNKWNRAVLFKSVRSGYDTSAVMEIPDLARLEKLHISPVIFQKQIMGKEITVCLLGNNILANEIEYINNNPVSKPVSLPEELNKNIIKLSKHINAPWILMNFLFQEDNNDYFAYSINIYPDFDVVYSIYGEPFTTLLKGYLVEEYNK
ncbi:MAG: hypothetical protein AB1782_01325 [Cyanobacteriota bacterium]